MKSSTLFHSSYRKNSLFYKTKNPPGIRADAGFPRGALHIVSAPTPMRRAGSREVVGSGCGSSRTCARPSETLLQGSFLSLIHTAELNGIDPFHYLTELIRHRGEIAGRTVDWLPWNYRDTLARGSENDQTLARLKEIRP